MTKNTLSGYHINRTLAFLTIPSYRNKYLSSLRTDSQREWARQLLLDYETGWLEKLELVPEQDSICIKCHPFGRTECTYIVEPLTLSQRTYPFGETRIGGLLENFNPAEFLEKESRDEIAFRYHLFQHM